MPMLATIHSPEGTFRLESQLGHLWLICPDGRHKGVDNMEHAERVAKEWTPEGCTPRPTAVEAMAEAAQEDPYGWGDRLGAWA